MHARQRWAGVVLTSALALSACGDSGDSPQSNGATSQGAPANTTTATPEVDEALNAKVTGGVLDFIAYCKRVTAGQDTSNAMQDKALDGLSAVVEAAQANPDVKLRNNLTPRRAVGDLLTVAKEEDCDKASAIRLESTLQSLPR